MKFMLDTQIYDLVITVPSLVDRVNQLTDEGKIIILGTHIQDDELRSIKDNHKREEVFRIKRQIISTAGGVYGISKYGLASYGNGGQSGVVIDQIRSPMKGHSKDSLIATTAARDADVFVTEDQRLRNRFKTALPACKIWKFEQFKQYLLACKD